MDSERKQPKVAKLISRGLLAACPACGARKQFRFWLKMRDVCHRCDLKFERIDGHWTGAIGINTILSFGVLVLSLGVSFALTIPDIPEVPLVVGHVALALIAPIVFFPTSRTLWTAIDIAMRPLEADEVDWSVLDRQ